MSTPNPKDILQQVPGRLCINPASLAGGYPHGGKGLGNLRRIQVRPNIQTKALVAEEYGNQPFNYLEVGQSWVFTAELRDMDPDAIATCFPGGAAGASGRGKIEVNMGDPAKRTVGRSLADSSVVLVFSPVNPDHHPFVVFHRALPMVDLAAEMNLALPSPFAVLVAFAAIIAPNGKVYSAGLRTEIAL